MPEGDTIWHAAKRIRDALARAEITAIETPQARHRRDRWPERLAGAGVRGVDSHGKHLFIRFDNGLTLHSHLRMTGAWRVFGKGERWRRSPRRAWLVIRTPVHDVVQFDGPVLELMTDSRTRFDRRLAELGPDVLAEEFDSRRFIVRLRESDPTRPIGDALLDQRNVAGIGNIWRAESCFMARVDPWRPTAQVSDAEALAIIEAARPPMALSAERGGPTVTVEPDDPPAHGERTWVYRRAGRPCRRCASQVRSRVGGNDGRTTYWCPVCQR